MYQYILIIQLSLFDIPGSMTTRNVTLLEFFNPTKVSYYIRFSYYTVTNLNNPADQVSITNVRLLRGSITTQPSEICELLYHPCGQTIFDYSNILFAQTLVILLSPL